MGQGGKIILVNGTKYDWIRTNQSSYQMDSWNFPDRVQSGKTATVYVEWTQGMFKTERDDSGSARYTLNGINQSFEVQARANNGFNIQVALTNIATSGNAQGSIINLGWNHNGSVVFILSGDLGNFTSSNIPTSWMQNSLSVLRNRKLQNLCLPGSHDAGMSIRTSGTSFGFECNTLTQTTSILGQLKYGMRYFDIRPVIADGDQFFTGHYGKVRDLIWQGSNGQSIQSIIDDVNTFTASNKEFIILYLSHSLNTEVGIDSYRKFNQDEWNRLFAQLTDSQKGLKHLFAYDYDVEKGLDLTQLTLGDFISDRAAVIVVVETSENYNVDLGYYAKAGFYTSSNFSVYNEYANKNDLNGMTSDQLTKMKTEKAKSNPSYFLLSWTLTQSDRQAGGLGDSIKDLANTANSSLYEMLLPNCSDRCYPNILYVDNVQTSNIAALAMAVNSITA
jgi:hypothetical protein